MFIQILYIDDIGRDTSSVKPKKSKSSSSKNDRYKSKTSSSNTTDSPVDHANAEDDSISIATLSRQATETSSTDRNDANIASKIHKKKSHKVQIPTTEDEPSEKKSHKKKSKPITTTSTTESTAAEDKVTTKPTVSHKKKVKPVESSSAPTSADTDAAVTTATIDTNAGIDVASATVDDTATITDTHAISYSPRVSAPRAPSPIIPDTSQEAQPNERVVNDDSVSYQGYTMTDFEGEPLPELEQDLNDIPSASDRLLEEQDEDEGYGDQQSVVDGSSNAAVADKETADNDDDDDKAEPTAASKAQKKKRNRSNTDCIDLLMLESLDTGGNRYQSHRAAAAVAKTKLALPKTGRGSSRSDISYELETTSPRTPSTPAIKRGYKRKTESIKVTEAPWVACDLCTKWRKLPIDVDKDTLPEQWYCTMNIWDPLRNTCDEPEEEASAEPDELLETADGVSAAPTIDDEDGLGRTFKLQRVSSCSSDDPLRSSRGRGRGRWGARGGAVRGRPARVPSIAQDDDSVDNAPLNSRSDDAQGDATGETGVGKRRGSTIGRWSNKPQSATAASSSLDSLNWVECNKCKKWRVVGAGIRVEDLPEVWVCADNTWNIAYSSCSAGLEPDPTLSYGPSADTPASRGPGRRYLGGGGGGADSLQSTTVDGVKKVTQWVQCERKNCKKWRKIPPTVDMSSFPEKWYCEMNRWDPDRATCDSLEDSDSEGEKGGSGARNQLILANSKGPSTLSYRRIIFGTDGRIRPAYSERSKNSYGIFSYTESISANNRAQQFEGEEEMSEPLRRVHYWNSCFFDHNAPIASAPPPTKSEKAVQDTLPIEYSPDIFNIALAPEPLPSSPSPPEPTYLLDAAQRLMSSLYRPTNTSTDSSALQQPHPQPLNTSLPSKLALKRGERATQHQQTVAKLPLYQRLQLEANVIRSSLSALPGYIPGKTTFFHSEVYLLTR